jgi:hypothetical protein
LTHIPQIKPTAGSRHPILYGNDIPFFDELQIFFLMAA